MRRRLFKAMGTEIELLVQSDAADAELARAETEFHRLEELLTRFDPGSELSLLNTEGSLEAGATLEVVRVAVQVARRPTAASTRPCTTRSRGRLRPDL